jgi:phage terminase small subunit
MSNQEENKTEETEDKPKLKPLTLKQKLFCRYYILGVEGDKGFRRGNGVKSYAKAFEKDAETTKSENYFACGERAKMLLKQENIKEYMADLLLTAGLSNEAIDSRLCEIIFGTDDKASIRAVGEYNKLKQRIINRDKGLEEIGDSIKKISGFNVLPPADLKTTSTTVLEAELAKRNDRREIKSESDSVSIKDFSTEILKRELRDRGEMRKPIEDTGEQDDKEDNGLKVNYAGKITPLKGVDSDALLKELENRGEIKIKEVDDF